MTTTTKFPFQIYGVDPRGFNVVTGGRSEITAKGKTILLGDVLEITEDVYKLNCDVNGDSWLDMTDEEQIARYGRVRFSLGELPEHVAALVQEQRAENIREEIANLKFTNPALAKRTAAADRLAQLEAELGV